MGSISADVERCLEEEAESTSLLQVTRQVSQYSGHDEHIEDMGLPAAVLMDLWAGQDLTSEQLLAVQKRPEKAKWTQMEAASVKWWPHTARRVRIAAYENMQQRRQDSRRERKAAAGPQKKGYVLTGLFDTGTNLFHEMINLNFQSIENRQSMWKHSLMGAEAITDYLRNDDALNQTLNETVLVAMVRSPISNLVSLKKAPYSMQDCFMDKSWSEIARQPCYGWVRTFESHEVFIQKKLYRSHILFKSSMDAYNAYLKQYLDLQAAGNFKKVLIVNYEDLVLDPEEVMRIFADAASVELPSSIKIVDAPAKVHGSSHGREAALLGIKERAYIEKFDGKQVALKTLCRGLDMKLIADRMEGSYRDRAEQRPYSADCDPLKLS